MPCSDLPVASRHLAQESEGAPAHRRVADGACLAQRPLEARHGGLAILQSQQHPSLQLPGAGEESMSLRAGIAAGGSSTIAMLALLNGLDELEREAATLLAPDIQDTLGVSDLVIGVITVGADGRMQPLTHAIAVGGSWCRGRLHDVGSVVRSHHPLRGDH